MKNKFKNGHLAENGALVLPTTPTRIEKMQQGAEARRARDRMPKREVELNWIPRKDVK